MTVALGKMIREMQTYRMMMTIAVLMLHRELTFHKDSKDYQHVSHAFV